MAITPEITDALLQWAEKNSYPNEFGAKVYSPFVCHVMNLFDKRVHYGEHDCLWVSPYGFVPMAGCPLHDR
jgi:hypothetical protein